jgi:hypothetical protein
VSPPSWFDGRELRSLLTMRAYPGFEPPDFAGVMAIAVVSDIVMLARGGVAGPARTARHLWRMCTARRNYFRPWIIFEAVTLPGGSNCKVFSSFERLISRTL